MPRTIPLVGKLAVFHHACTCARVELVGDVGGAFVAGLGERLGGDSGGVDGGGDWGRVSDRGDVGVGKRGGVGDGGDVGIGEGGGVGEGGGLGVGEGGDGLLAVHEAVAAVEGWVEGDLAEHQMGVRLLRCLRR